MDNAFSEWIEAFLRMRRRQQLFQNDAFDFKVELKISIVGANKRMALLLPNNEISLEKYNAVL